MIFKAKSVMISVLEGKTMSLETCNDSAESVGQLLGMIGFKGAVPRDFRLLVFFMNQFTPSP
jgi:hypothetical protein